MPVVIPSPELYPIAKFEFPVVIAEPEPVPKNVFVAILLFPNPTVNPLILASLPTKSMPYIPLVVVPKSRFPPSHVDNVELLPIHVRLDSVALTPTEALPINILFAPLVFAFVPVPYPELRPIAVLFDAVVKYKEFEPIAVSHFGQVKL